jgi:hypothetical protein
VELGRTFKSVKLTPKDLFLSLNFPKKAEIQYLFMGMWTSNGRTANQQLTLLLATMSEENETNLEQQFNLLVRCLFAR